MDRQVNILVHGPRDPDDVASQYDIHKDPHRNIALPDSLLSRFDLLFIVTDDVNEEHDRTIADHVLRMHRYLPPGVEEGTPTFDNSAQSLNVADPTQADADHEPQEVSPFEKFDPLLHIGVTKSLSSTRRGKEKKMELLSIAFIKKYIQYAKDRSPPALTKGAADLIVNFYATLRNEDSERNLKKVYHHLPFSMSIQIRSC
jgi:DNA replication licensing factor MCM3